MFEKRGRAEPLSVEKSKEIPFQIADPILREWLSKPTKWRRIFFDFAPYRLQHIAFFLLTSNRARRAICMSPATLARGYFLFPGDTDVTGD
jgi:hypothetical protein